MTSNHHTPIPSSPQQPANASTINSPLGELDAAITDHESRIGDLEADMPVPSGNPTEYLDGEGNWTVPEGTGAGVDGHVIQSEGVDLPQRAKINFVGAGVTVTNEAGGTQVEIPGVSDVLTKDGLTNWDEQSSDPSTPEANKWKLFFKSDGLYIMDDAGIVVGPITINHGALTGLSDDNHPQYLLATGLREWSEQGSDPSTPAANKWKLYFKSSGLYLIDDAGTVTGPLGAGDSGDWASDAAVWTRTGNHTFTVSGDRRSEFRPGVTKVKYDDGGGDEFGVVGSSSHSGGTTTVNLIPNSDYAMAGNPTTRAISYLESPVGYPVWFNYTVTWGASGSMTFTSVTPKFTRWRVVGGNTIKVIGRGVGTTGGTASSTLTATLPWNAKHGADNPSGVAYISDTTGVAGYCYLTADKVNGKKYDGSNFGLGGARWFVYDVCYEME